jgi:hypothetical protein
MNKKGIYLVVFFALLVFAPGVWADPVQWSTSAGGNGHYYLRVDLEEAVEWDGAKEASENWQWMGLQGHLATITSVAENLFITNSLDSSARWGDGMLFEYWLGGYQPSGSVEPAGNWKWVTGEAFSYANWAPDEPNNAGDEGYLHFWQNINNDGREWNDIASDFGAWGYVVEFEAPSSNVPIPAAGWLLGSGLLALIGMRKRVK